jgi:hypothetical protein
MQYPLQALLAATSWFVLVLGTVSTDIHKTEPNRLKSVCTAYHWGETELLSGTKAGDKKPDPGELELMFDDTIAQHATSDSTAYIERRGKTGEKYVWKSYLEHNTEVLGSNRSIGASVPFNPHYRDSDSACSQNVLGKLMLVADAGGRHEAAAGGIGQELILSLSSIGQGSKLRLSPSPRAKIGSRKKRPDMSIGPRNGGIGNGMLDNGYGFPFPNLIVEVACSESREDLIKDLETWMSPRTSVQVAIGIKIQMCKGNSVDGAVETIEAILYRRNTPNPEQLIQFHPTQLDERPVLLLHLVDLFFGVARDRLSDDLQQRLERDETIEVDLASLRQDILG